MKFEVVHCVLAFVVLALNMASCRAPFGDVLAVGIWGLVAGLSLMRALAFPVRRAA